MLQLTLGLLIACAWGLADTAAAFALRHIAAVPVTFLAQATGLIILACVGILWFDKLGLSTLSPSKMIWIVLAGILIGIFAISGYTAQYQSFEKGPLAIVSPIIAANGGITLLLSVFFLGERLELPDLVMLLVLLVGVVLAATKVSAFSLVRRSPSSLISRGMALAITALFGLGILNFGIGAAAQVTNWYLVILASRMFSMIYLLIYTHLIHPSMEIKKVQPLRLGFWYLLAGCSGVFEMLGLIVFGIAARQQQTGPIAVIASSYIVISVFAGVVFFRERLSLRQMAGILLVAIGIAGLANSFLEGIALTAALLVAFGYTTFLLGVQSRASGLLK